MSLLFGGEKRAVNLPWLRGEDPIAWRSLAGEPVDWSTAIGLDAVAAVIGLISDVVYMLPLKAYRDMDGLAIPTPGQRIVEAPSRVMDAGSWRAQLVVSWMLWGNAYGLVRSIGDSGRPLEVEWLDPSIVTVQEFEGVNGPITYFAGGTQIQGFTADRAAENTLVHLPGRYQRPGYRQALVPLERFRETFGLAAAARNYGARWFGEGAHPSAILQTDQSITEEVARTIKDRFMSAIRGRREPAVLGAGVTYEQIQTSPGESQMIESQQHAAVAVARALGLLQPEMIGAAVSGSSVTYANREQRAIDFLTYSVDPYLVRIENALTRWLPTAQGGSFPNTGTYARFNRGALLRTDLTTRYAAHDTAIRGGWRTPNEVRRLEDEPPFADGGDEHLWPPYATDIANTVMEVQ